MLCNPADTNYLLCVPVSAARRRSGGETGIRSLYHQPYRRLCRIQDYKYERAVLGLGYEETTPPTRLEIGFLENNVGGGLRDGRYWPP